MARGLRDSIVTAGAEPSRVEGSRVPLDVAVAGGQLVYVQCQSVNGADCRVVVEPDLGSGDRARPGSERRQVLPELRWASALMHHQVPRVVSLVLQRVHRQCGSCGTAVATSRVVQRGDPRGLGWPAPSCTITHSAQSCACSASRAHWLSVVTNHTDVGAWDRGRRGLGHATSALGAWCSPSTSTSGECT